MADTTVQRPTQRPRTSSMLSWGSQKSKDSGTKTDLVETERDKAQRRITGKADPSVAINELQPAARALEKNTLPALRTMQFRDHKGDLITDPDRSNPTRPRFERPLDTIRSFEAAVDSGYGRRRNTTQDTQSRRSSFYQGFASPQPRTPMSANNPYFDRQPDSRPESLYDQPPQQYNQYPGGSANGYSARGRMPHGRMNSEPVYNAHAPPRHGYQQSYDTATASSSGTYQTEPGTASTDPSSYSGSNGEVNHMVQYSRPQPPVPQETYGIEFDDREDEYGMPLPGHAQLSPPPLPPAHGMPARGMSYGSPGDMGAPPPPPPHANAGRGTLRKPVGNNGQVPPSSGNYYGQQSEERPKAEKRKSWLARRFSKQG